MGLAGISVNLFNCFFIILLFGAGIDYSGYALIAELDAYRGYGEHQSVSFGATALCFIVTICSFLALAVAQHPALFSIGMAGLITMSSSMLVAAFVVPPIARWLLPRDRSRVAPSARMLLKGWLAGGFVAAAALAYFAVVRPVLRLWHRGNIQGRQRAVRSYLRSVARLLVRRLPGRRSERIFIGAGPEAFATPAVVVSDLCSAFDVLMLLALPCDMVMTVSRRVWASPLWGRWARDAGFILSETGSESLLTQGVERLSQGVSVAVLGPRVARRQPGVRELCAGAFELAARAGADVVPVLLTGTEQCLPRGARWIGDHTCIARILPRLQAADAGEPPSAIVLQRRALQLMLEHEAADGIRCRAGRAFWGNLCGLYRYHGPYVEGLVRWKTRRDPAYRHLSDVVPASGEIVEVGCGYGMLSSILALKCPQRKVLGVDPDARKIAVGASAARAVPGLRFAQANLLEWECPPADCVLLLDVLHSLPADKQGQLVAKVAASLRSGGTLVFREALAADSRGHRRIGWTERLKGLLGWRKRAEGSWLGSADDYRSLFQGAGLSLCRQEAGWPPGPNAVMIFRKQCDRAEMVGTVEGVHSDRPCIVAEETLGH